jgi:exodeoxyribonuclease VII large subunit
MPRQRLDTASDKLQHGLLRNLQVHAVRFNRSAARLRAPMLKDRMNICVERVGVLAARAMRAQRTRLAQARHRLDGLERLLESVSHKSVLDRGFALVRGEGGQVRRRAGQVKAGETLTLTFADGDKQVTADGGVPRSKAKKPADQGSLF